MLFISTIPTARRTKKMLGLSGVMLAATLAGCAKPAEVAVQPPPPPVGHIFPTLVEMPTPPKYVHIKPEDLAQDQQAFNVLGLKSALMVGALTCAQQSQYDTFMGRFQPHILAEQHVVDAYFRRIKGRYYQADEDDFVTLLANNQTVGGLSQGGMFCLNNKAEFDKVATMSTPEDLDGFVTNQSPDPVVQPVVTTPKPVVKTYKKPMKKAAVKKPASSSTISTAPHS